ncbi:recombinase family protein [Acinetobacter lwoffii]|uniref:recombinase family protein n=1 Tax=Acinetobacter lwoffii TaxID=28090 RepID=UPI003BF66630
MNTSKGYLVGYIRVSSVDQNTERQLADIELDRCYIDKITGIRSKRPQLEEMMMFVREGDTVIVHSLDRLARDLFLLLKIIEKLNKKGVSVKFLKENLTFNSFSKNPMDELILHIFGAVAQFQRSIIKEAQREGIKLRKDRGEYKGRKRVFTDEKLNELKDILRKKNSNVKEYKKIRYSAIAKKFNVSTVTLWRYRKEIEAENLRYRNFIQLSNQLPTVPYIANFKQIN